MKLFSCRATHDHLIRITVAGLSLALLASGGPIADIPPPGKTSAEAIRKFQEEIAQHPRIKRYKDSPGPRYMVINPDADTFVYFFTGPTEPAHPSMIAITIHPMEDPFQPKKNEVEFHESYAGSEAEFLTWSKRASYEFGRGFAAG